ncbi:MAG: site-specific DNA-methyltransferase [Armatimonadetes bacterium]|nr:site-specific DNA-methyltransferase [Armatimonadota bacterium]
MSLLDDLILRVRDEHLRNEIATELAMFKKDRTFGLVFEQHSPEVVPLPGLAAHAGSLVQLRKNAPGAVFQVVTISGDSATLKRVDDEGDDETMAVSIDQLIPVKSFRESVYSALIPQGSEENGPHDRPSHMVINGENFHSLKMLKFIMRGKVDCIYIDPPYNTGSSDWKYNNRYIEESDQWRHSKWLSFMERRLRIAKELLKPETGVLIVTIGEHEVHHLAMLLESMFNAYNQYMVSVVHNPKGTFKSNFARVCEYALFVVPKAAGDIMNPAPVGMFAQVRQPQDVANVADAEDNTDEPSAPEHEDLYLRRRGQQSGHRHQRPNQFYAILVNERTREVVGVGPPLGRDESYEVHRDGDVITVYPLDTLNHERVWRYERTQMQDYIDAGVIIVTGFSSRTGQGWVLNHRVVKKNVKRLKTVWWEKRHDAGAHGADLLTAYLGQSNLFPFPKSVYAVRDCLAAVVANRPDAVILDFFAGSGTTYHATCLLNAEDGGRRRSVMITNNELSEAEAKRFARRGIYPGNPEYEAQGVYELVTKPRAKAVTTGKRPDGLPVQGEHTWAERRPYSQGFSENVHFYSLAYLDPDNVDLGREFSSIAPCIWQAAGGFGSPHELIEDRDYLVSDSTHVAILFDESSFPRLRDAIAASTSITHCYLVTDSPEAYAEMRSQLPTTLTVNMLYRDYLRNFQIGVGSSQ